MAGVSFKPRLFRFVVGAAIGAEEQIHHRRDVRVVPGPAVPIVVPVVQFRRADQLCRKGLIGSRTFE